MSRPKKIILIRHGESIGNVDKSHYKTIPDYAIQLTENGKKQAFNAGIELHKITGDSVKFYVSPFWRTRQTYKEIKKSYPNETLLYEDPRLREQEWHGKLPLDGYMSALEMERDSYGHFYYRFEGGESCADCFDRASVFLDTLFRDFEKKDFPENAFIVTHGMYIRVLLMRFFHLSVEEFEILRNPKNCQYFILSLQENNKYKLLTELEKYEEYKHNYQFDWNA